MGVAKDMLARAGSTNNFLSVSKGTNNRIDYKVEDNTDTLVYRLQFATANFVQGTKYLILLSVDSATVGAKGVIINVDTGAIHETISDTSPIGVTMATTSADWTIGAASGTGVRAVNGQMERAMVWFGVAPDITNTAVQEYFYKNGGLRNPVDVVASIGATPIINVVGADMSTGTNRGTGGNFVPYGSIVNAG
jgi:hypothetical protein